MNWILQEHISNFEILSKKYMPFYKEYLINNGIIVNDDFSKSTSFINWSLYINKFQLYYDYDGCEKEVLEKLKNSDLKNSISVTMDLGYNNPVILIDTQYFIENWSDFITGANFESTVVSTDGIYCLEFLKNGTLISNFII